MRCIITIPGDGKGRYGKPKNDRTGPVEEFVVDNGYFYPRVFAHVEKCKLCDPTEVLHKYLERRLAKEEQGVTPTFVKLARRYYRLNRGIPKSLLREIEIRSGINNEIDRSDFTLIELAKAVRIQCANRWFAANSLSYTGDDDSGQLVAFLIPLVKDVPFKKVWAMTDNDESDLRESDLRKLIEVASVMAT
jgi:hypothetical protein